MLKKETLAQMSKMKFREPATDEMLERLEQTMNSHFPNAYKDFLLYSNGAEGTIGPSYYLSLWSIEDIKDLNDEYGVSDFTPGLIYFGSDGGDIAFAFDIQNDYSIVEFPFESIHIEDAKFIGKDFDEFIRQLSNR